MADAPHMKLAIVPETDSAAGDEPATAIVVLCDAGSDGGGGTISTPDAHSAAGDGDWRTATLRAGEAYPSEAPCVEFQSSALGFSSRQASIHCIESHPLVSGQQSMMCAHRMHASALRGPNPVKCRLRTLRAGDRA